MSLNNFQASVNILTKFFQTTCREVGMIARVQRLEGPPPKFSRAKKVFHKFHNFTVHNFFCPTWKGLRLIKLFFRCSICRSFPEIFAIKVENYQKSRRNLDVFWPTEILGAGLPKVVHALSSLPRGMSSGKIL